MYGVFVVIYCKLLVIYSILTNCQKSWCSSPAGWISWIRREAVCWDKKNR